MTKKDKSQKNKIIVICGPTATGKTSTAISIAQKTNGEVINFDSLLFYKELNIGTAKPSVEETQGVVHHMMSTHTIFDPINAAGYLKEATPIINKCHQEGKTAILVGGSGFYLQAVLKGMYESTTTSDDILAKSNKLYAAEGISPFLKVLEKNDQASFTRYHQNDHYRIRRAVEHFWTTGDLFSTARDKMRDRLKDSPINKYHWDVHTVYLDLPKEKHFEIITQRTEEMFNAGLVNEITKLLENGATGSEKPLNSIGYKEVIKFLKEKNCNLTELKERISINTRRLAKSQRTWFNKQEKICYHPIEDQAKIEQECLNFIKS